MIMVFSSDTGLRLIEADEFRSFKMVTDVPLADIPNFEGLRFEGDSVAWTKRDFVRSLLGVPPSLHWDDAFDAMIGKAAKHGWVNAAGEIRIHVEHS